MKVRRLLCAVLLLSLIVPFCFAGNRGPSTPEERARAVQVAKKMEADPLSKDIKSDREWLIMWAIQIPDITVHVCPSPLYEVLPKKYKYSPELTGQMMASGMAFLIEHPEQSNDRNAEYQAALEGALRAYEAIVKQEPKARVEKVDELIKTRDTVGLAGYVKKVAEAKCKA